MQRVLPVVAKCVLALLLANEACPADPGTATTQPAAAASAEAGDVPSYDEVPLFRLGGRAGLPAYLKASATTLGDATGISAKGDMRTVASNFATRDFTFDVVYRSQPGEQSIFRVGIGSSDWEVFSRVHGPGHRGAVTFSQTAQAEQSVGSTADHAGPHVIRLEKRGEAFTISLCAAFDGKTFEATSSKTLPDFSAAAPLLKRHNSPLFLGAGNGATIEAVRLIIDGKPAYAGKSPPAAARAKQTPATTDPSTMATAAAPSAEPAPAVPSADGESAKVARRQTSIRGLTVSLTDTGQMLGGTSDLILTATPGEARPDTPVTFVTPVGPQMTLVVDDVLRSVRIRYPVWEADKVELTFDDRISKKDGSSVGAAVGTMILSMLEGFEIDPNLAMTGDVTADGKVRAIGGVAAKIRAATNSGAAIVAVPADNYDQVADGLVYEGPTLLSKIQVIGIATLQDAAATARIDRPVKLAEALKLFAEVQESLKKSPGELKGKPVREKLTQIVALAPNHHSAQLLLLVSQGKQPRRLSSGASLYYMAVAIRGVMPALQQQAWAMDRQRVPPVAVKEGLKSLDRLRWIADPAMQPLVDAYRDFIRAVSDAQSGSGSLATVRARARAVNDAEAKVNANRNVMEKMLKEGV